MPHICGETIACTNAAVTAASTALPPAIRTLAPSSTADGCGATIALGMAIGPFCVVYAAVVCKIGHVSHAMPGSAGRGEFRVL
jgi:hypothetical protein